MARRYSLLSDRSPLSIIAYGVVVLGFAAAVGLWYPVRWFVEGLREERNARRR